MDDPRDRSVDAETLSALLDGTLSAEERERVLEALARSPGEYEQLVESAALLRTLGDEPGELVNTDDAAPPGVASRVRWRAGPFRLLIPALAAAGIVAVVFVARDARDPDGAAGTVASLVETLEAPPGAATFGADWSVPAWSATRGGEDQLAAPSRALRLGASWVQLELGLRGADTTAARAAATSIAVLVGPVRGAPLALRAEAAAARMDTATLDGEVMRSLRGSVDSAWFDLGAWLETSRLAARAGRTRYFVPDSKAMRALSAVLAAVERSPSASAQDRATALARVRALSSKPASTDADARELGATIERIIADLAR